MLLLAVGAVCICSLVGVRYLQGVRVFYAAMGFTTIGMLACQTPIEAGMLFVAQLAVLAANRETILRSVKPRALSSADVAHMSRILLARRALS